MLKEPIIINQWSGGIADSAYEGIPGSFAEMVGLDIHSEPGIVKIRGRMDTATGAISGKIRAFVSSTNTESYAVGGYNNSSYIYKSTNSGATWAGMGIPALSTGEARNAIIWKSHLIVATDDKLDAYNFDTHVWTIGFATLTKDVNYHPMWEGKRDGKLYIAGGNIVSKLEETSGDNFDAATGASFSFTASALDLPEDFKIQSMEEVGQYLLLGCRKTSDSTTDTSMPTAIIYPWNYVLRPSSYDAPIDIRRFKGVSAQLNINNTYFAWIGARGELFQFTGTKFAKLKRVPGYTTDIVQPNAVLTNFNDIPYFGLENPATGGGGIYGYGSLSKDYPSVLSLDYPLSAGQNANYSVDALGTTGTTDNILLASFTVGSSYYIDYLNTSATYGAAYFVTRVMRIGTAEHKQNVSGFEIVLNEAGATDTGVTLYYRRDTEASWTTIGSLLSAKREKWIPFEINDVVNLQVKAELTGAVKLKEIRIK